MARAIATRCFCPPDNLVIERFSKPSKRTSFKLSETRLAISFLSTPLILRAKATLSKTFIFGKRA